MMHGFQLDPHAILGLAPGASPQEVREAYRLKTKKHHPDHGGDEWAFRVVVRAYQLLTTTPPDVRRAPSATAPPRRPAPAADQVRPGVADRVADPRKVVDVEILWLRFAVADLFELVGDDDDDRNLSGSINVVWPGSGQPVPGVDAREDDEILRLLDEVFDDMRVKTRVVSSRCRREGGRFVGWLSYPSGDRAWKAFQALHEALKARGLGVRQWTRDMIIPRD